MRGADLLRKPDLQVPFLPLRRSFVELENELEVALADVMASGRYILGHELRAFEDEWASYCGVEHCVGVGNGLSALELTLRAWGIGQGSEVIVPTNTFIASWLAVANVGAALRPVEPNPTTFTLDPHLVADAITDRTRVIMPVHLFGQCDAMDVICELAQNHDIRILEDAAQAHGCEFHDRKAGALGDAGAFSFYPVKNLGAFGDGGAVTTNDPHLASEVRRLRNYGLDRDQRHVQLGTNSRLDEVQAALLRVGLRHLEERNRRRAELAARYTAGLSDLDGLQLPIVAAGCRPAWHVYVVHHQRRDAIRKFLEDAGVGTQTYYPVPPHLSGAFAGTWGPGAFPIAERLAATNVALPLYPQLSNAEQDYVIAGLRQAMSRLPAT
jgi:dTDP-4-amino-4,6-dideoxygalactose transaminase